MRRTRVLIPCVMAVLCLAGAGFVASTYGTVEESRQRLMVGQSTDLRSMELEDGVRYELTLEAAYAAHNQGETTAWIEVSVTPDEEEEPIFVMASDLWVEAGVWHEEGESGTWQEEDLATEMAFVVPAKGHYVISLELEESTTPDTIVTVDVGVHRVAHSFWPLIGAAGVLLLVAGWIYYRHPQFLRRHLLRAGAGTRLRIRTLEYVVEDLRIHTEEGEPEMPELSLRGSDGALYMLAFDSLYWEFEGRERTREVTVPVLLFGSGDEVEPKNRGRHMELDNVAYLPLPEGRGTAWQEAYRDGQVFRTRYRYHQYCGLMSDVGEAFGPARMKRPDQAVLEQVTFDDGESEWSLMRTLGWNEVQVLHFEERPKEAEKRQ